MLLGDIKTMEVRANHALFLFDPKDRQREVPDARRVFRDDLRGRIQLMVVDAPIWNSGPHQL
jgi:hypothetical protein